MTVQPPFTLEESDVWRAIEDARRKVAELRERSRYQPALDHIEAAMDVFREVSTRRPSVTPISAREGCCGLCDEMYRDSLDVEDWVRFQRPFIVCPSCGNKRCPKATDHRLACSGSNESGQAGSRYR